MDWFCCSTPKTVQAIQQYHPNTDIPFSRKATKQKRQTTMGRATQEQTSKNIKNQMERLKPRNSYDLQSSPEGFSVSQMKKNKSSNGVFKKIQKSNYQEILEKCEKTGIPWKDPDFDTTKQTNNKTHVHIDNWQRITKIIPNCSLMEYPIRPNDIKQGSSNNCYFLSAVSALAQREYRIKSIFGSHEISKWGVYMCKLLFNGIYQEVVIDDYFPLLASEPGQYKLYGCKPTNGTDIWVLILEKCWAKLLGGYDKIQFRFNIESLWCLTASPTLGQFATINFKDSTVSKQLFKKLIEYDEVHNYVITSSVDYTHAMTQYNLASRHSYTVIGLFQVKDAQDNTVRLVQIRNPLKNSIMPKLPYNFKDSFWNKAGQKQKDFLQSWRIQKQGEDGIFYVDWQNYIDLFNQICVSKINDNAHYFYENVTMQQGKPLFVSIQITTSDDNFYLIIAQHAVIDNKSNPNNPYANIRVLAAEVNTSFKNQKQYKYVCSKSYLKNINDNYLYVDCGKLNVGKYEIRIIINNPSKKQEQLVLGYYSSSDFTVNIVNDINDSFFISKTLLNRARQIPFTKPNQEKTPNKVIKEKLVNAEGWRCIENIFESNICYIAYHIQHSSLNQTYSVQIDSKKDDSYVIFQGIALKQKQLKLQMKKGEQALIPYMYHDSKWLGNYQINPMLVDQRKLPKPSLIPLN